MKKAKSTATFSAIIDKDLKDKSINIIQNQMHMTIKAFVEQKLRELIKKK